MQSRLSKDEQKAVQIYLDRVRRINKYFTPSDWQRPVVNAIFKEGYKLVFLKAGRSSGKSHLVKYLLYRMASCFSGTSAYMIGPTRKQQAEIAWEQADGLPRFVDINEMGAVAKQSEHRIEIPKLNSFIKIDGSEEFFSYRGVPFNIMGLDEWQNQDPRFLDAAYPNLFKRKDAVLILIGHPSSLGENHFDEKWEEIQDDKRWFKVHATCFDNPYLDKDALLEEKKRYIARGEYYEWMCEYEATRGKGGKRAIFPTLTKARHTRPRDVLLREIERDKQRLLYGHGLDPGSSVCFGGVLACYNEHLGKVYILDELKVSDEGQVSTGKVWPVVQEQKQRLVPPGAFYTAVYDEAARWFEREVADQFGEGLTPTQKSLHQKEEGLGLIRDLLANDNIVIAEECVWLIEQMIKYKREENGLIKKRFDDIIDALRYILAELGVKAAPSSNLIARPNDVSLIAKPQLQKVGLDEYMHRQQAAEGGFRIW